MPTTVLSNHYFHYNVDYVYVDGGYYDSIYANAFAHTNTLWLVRCESHRLLHRPFRVGTLVRQCLDSRSLSTAHVHAHLKPPS